MMRNSSDGNLPRLFQIFHGEVASLQSYGAFIRIPGCRKQGLLHKSQMSNGRVEDPSEMLMKGERVFCKVIAMEDDGEKIALSMKVVSQSSGKDLDPNNIQSSQDEKRRRQFNPHDRRKIELGAELNTTCRRCGGHGHLAMDCYVAKGDNQYSLIPDFKFAGGNERSYRGYERKEESKKKPQKSRKRSSSPDDSDSDAGQRKKPTRIISVDRSSRREKNRQSSDSEGSRSEVDERGKRKDRWEGKDDRHGRFGESSRSEKYGSKRKAVGSDSDSDSESQRRRRPAGNSQEFQQAADRARQRSGSRERKRKDGYEREKIRNTKDERDPSRGHFSFSGSRERGTERHSEMAKKRSRSDSSDDDPRMGDKRGKINREKSHKRRL